MPDLSTPQARLAFVTPFATRYGLDPAIVAAVCEQESAWDPFAVRFEPGFLQRYVKPANPVAPTTMEIMRACSFGLMQIMGEVAMEFGWRGYYLTDLCDPAKGVDYGCKKLQKCFFVHGNIDDTALLAYNGGGNPNYGAQVLARVKNYQNLGGQSQ
jgi:soluble lytic murein transglycosylase-like protein